MRILSIETSCDETGVSILECFSNKGGASFKVLANSLNSQIKIHAQYGGVFPALAKREHQKNLPILLKRTLEKAKLRTSPPTRSPNKGEGVQKNTRQDLVSINPGIDLIVVTSGPGLEPALWTGIVFAKELAKKWNIPVMPVNHMEGHILSVFGNNKGKFTIDFKKIKFPIISLLVSGGHTELVLSKKMRDYKILGETLDDAVGEAFDKVARMLLLPYPGGPEISKLAEKARKNLIPLPLDKGENERGFFKNSPHPNPLRVSERGQINNFSLPRPMIHSKNFDFSFSGLKTAVLYLIRDLKENDPNILQNDLPTGQAGNIKEAIAMEFENAVVETLIHKTKKAVEKYQANTLIVAGGVASNKFLRKELKKEFGNKNLFFPDKNLATDNSVMIGMAGYIKYLEKNGKVPKSPRIKAEGGLRL